MLPRCWGAYPVGQHDVIYRVVPLWQGCDHGTLAGYCIQVKTGKVCICTACTATYPAQGNHTLAGNEQHTLAGCLCVLHVPKVMGSTPCGTAHPVQSGITLAGYSHGTLAGYSIPLKPGTVYIYMHSLHSYVPWTGCPHPGR